MINKIESIALDTEHINFNPGNIYENSPWEIDYIITRITSNNDWNIKDLLGDKRIGLITYTDTVKHLEFLLDHHLKKINREKIDILVVKYSNGDNVDEILNTYEQLKTSGKVDKLGLSCSEPVLDEKLVEDISYIMLPVSPLTYNNKLIGWARKNEKKIIGENPFGGVLSAARNIRSFTIPYLLKFSATNCEIPVLSGKELLRSVDMAAYIDTLKGKESSGMYLLNKSSSNQVKPLKKFTYTSENIDDDYIIPYDDPYLLPGGELTFGDYKVKFKEKQDSDDMSEIEVKVYDIINTIDLSGLSEETSFSVLRYKILDLLETEYILKGYRLSEYKQGNSIFMFNLVKPAKIKGHLWWSKIEKPINLGFVLTGYKGKYEFIEQILSSNLDNTL